MKENDGQKDHDCCKGFSFWFQPFGGLATLRFTNSRRIRFLLALASASMWEIWWICKPMSDQRGPSTRKRMVFICELVFFGKFTNPFISSAGPEAGGRSFVFQPPSASVSNRWKTSYAQPQLALVRTWKTSLSLFYYNQNGHGFSLLTLGFFLLAKRGKAKEAKAIDWL